MRSSRRGGARVVLQSALEMSRVARITLAAIFLLLDPCAGQSRYYGVPLGELSRLQHGVRGAVYAVDARTIYIRDFHYDGEGPAAYFIVGTGNTVGGRGSTRLRDERGASAPLRRYRGEHITLTLPEGHTPADYNWLAVWCDEFSVNFGSLSIPARAAYPKPVRAGALSGAHGVRSDPLVIVDAQTILLPNFSYDGEAPDAKFWVGRGERPSPQGIRIPDENGKEAPLGRYDKKTIVLTLPGELTVFDIGHLAVWCEAFTVNFGHVALSADKLRHVPPSLRMLGVSPQSKLNCEVLLEEAAFEVRWAVAGDSIVVQLVAKLEDGEYMSFGVSGSDSSSQMVGGDVAVAWAAGGGAALDYYLDAKSQCAGTAGTCPDQRLSEKTNSIRLLNAATVNGYSIVTYQRPLKAGDQLDRPVRVNGSQPVIWAIGPLNQRGEASYHSQYLKGDLFFEFGRPPVWNCPLPEEEPRNASSHEQPQKQQAVTPSPRLPPPPAAVPSVTPWQIPGVQCHEPADGVFYAQMGPTGGKRGYSAITGHVGWGISWYINGLLIPEITVVRGKTYTFVVEGGNDPEVPAKYHPFYITNDSVGGYQHKSEEEKKGVEIYAGVRRLRGGAVSPTGVGRLCSWTGSSPPDQFPSFGAYQRALTLVCEDGAPGLVHWTPGPQTPDTVYYQCYTHRHLGWKIHVVDECESADGEEPAGQESVQVEARLTPAQPDRRPPVHTKHDFPFSKMPGRRPPAVPPADRANDLFIPELRLSAPPQRPRPTHPGARPFTLQAMRGPAPPRRGPRPPPPLMRGAPPPPRYPLPLPPRPHTLNLGATEVVANQVVRSHITLPGPGEPPAPRPPQVVLGRPLERPQPLDQQMAPSSPPHVVYPEPPVAAAAPPSIKVESSNFISETAAETSSITPAVNTGFKPDSIVIESGFKPIIREPLMAGEDRIADYGPEGNNRREDTGLEEDYDGEPPQQPPPPALPSEKLTESFEPMFIPSPEDHMSPSLGAFPPNHAEEPRPHPIYVRQDDLAVAGSSAHAQYLPPDRTYTAYDGKLVSGLTLTGIEGNVASIEEGYGVQSRPYKGAAPPDITKLLLSEESLPMLNYSSSDSRTTPLKLINALYAERDEEVDALQLAASDLQPLAVLPLDTTSDTNTTTTTTTTTTSEDEYADEQEEDEEDDENEVSETEDQEDI